ncbi:hypothetical protein ACFLY9_00065 [Patescibacteria group bacterium]
MKNLKFKSFVKFVNSPDFDQITKDSLVISDIDGVFFRGIFDPREIIGVISKRNIKTFEKILETGTAIWIFTNRILLFKKFPFIKQLSRSFKKITSISPEVYSDCSQFLGNELKKYAIIMNAKKPGKESRSVVEKGINNFSTVVYIGARELPFYFNDLKLVSNLSKTVDSEKLTFVEISQSLKGKGKEARMV